MRRIDTISVLLGLYVLVPHAANAQTTAKLSLATCEGYYVGESSSDRRNVAAEPERFLKDKNRQPVDFLVLIENTSNRDIGIYRQWNSYGYYSIHFVVQDADGKQTTIEKGAQSWTKNYPDCFALPSGMTHAVPICFASKEWNGVQALQAKGARLKAVFEQEPIRNELSARWLEVPVFTNKVESSFVAWATLTGRKANQAEANGGQSVRSETNRTSAGAAPRRSP